ncbi:hypothetical protein N7481_007988 [Penicillium waksmanii]|uniref:uncharacterized protein n=1 Tax=Penicillium waksmanii TaxID=69791 RepID=UPI002549BBFC|nr:uncharacterized protein N7481_007988 [Penicillium waksmanii]KAJ5980690.1 hypothetical protein N7481_007988 [Penicillium waksmanii]
MDAGTFETLLAKAYILPDHPQRGIISLLFFLPVSTLDQFPATASSEEQNYTDNIPEKRSQQDSSGFQHSMTSNWEESPLEMQYSIHHVPLMLHGSASLAQLGPVSPTDVYDETAREYWSVANSNPYIDSMNVDELLAIPYGESSPCLEEKGQQSDLENSPQIRNMIRSISPDSMEASFPPHDETLQALVPEGLNLSFKTRHKFRPHLTIPENLIRPLSRTASVYEVKSPFSITARVVKSPDQSPLQSPNQSPQRSPTRSPSRSLATIEEEFGTDIGPGLKRKFAAHGGRVHKKLFGDNGWLDDHKPAPTLRRRPSVMRELGRKLKGLKGDYPKSSSPTSGPGSPVGSPSPLTPVSLTSSQQSKLYAELEVMICTTANDFISNQYYDGRVSRQSISKVHDFWSSKNRPRVTGFRFDQATQRDLIMANRRSLRFAGESSTNPIMLESNLSNWKKIAQEMNVRTFCLPDSAIRKHLHDTRNLLDMLDASLDTLQQFRGVSLQAQDEMMDEYIKRRPRTTSGYSALPMG